MAKRIVPIVLILAVAGYFGHRFRADRMALERDRSFYGTVEAVEVVLSSQVTGRILELPAEEGEPVEAGTLLARIDDALYRAQAEQAHAAIRSARSQMAVVNANLDGVRTALKRTLRLLAAGSATQAQIDELETREAGLLAQRQVVETQTAQAETALALAETQLGYTRIHAPISGTLTRRNAEPGETAFPGSALMTLSDLGVMKVKVYVPGPMLGRIGIGDPVDIVTDTYPGRPFHGTVESIAHEAEFTPKNVQTRQERVRLVYAVKVRVQNPDGVLKSGMPVDAAFRLE